MPAHFITWICVAVGSVSTLLVVPGRDQVGWQLQSGSNSGSGSHRAGKEPDPDPDPKNTGSTTPLVVAE